MSRRSPALSTHCRLGNPTWFRRRRLRMPPLDSGHRDADVERMGLRDTTRLAAATFAIAGPATAIGATAYVDTDGAATTGCTDPSNPCGTIADGIAAAGPGGEILVDEGEVCRRRR